MKPEDLRYLAALKRRRASLKAKDDLISFAKYMTPDPEALEDVDRSAYDAQKFHKVMAAALEEVEKGNIKRLIINLGPRHGKSQLSSRLFPAWYLGRNPRSSFIFATYNETLSWDFGRDVRNILRDPLYAQIFPEAVLKAGAAAVDRLELTQGGKMFLTGRAGSLTGRGAAVIVIDDILKDREEADSPVIREKMWSWYNQVLKTRLMTHTGAIVYIGTRWHEDDLVGRLTDPHNPSYSASEARKWKIIDLPALAKENDVLGRKENEALWPKRFPRDYLEELRDADPRGFQALYQGSPTPDKGNYFDGDRVRTYVRSFDRPPNDQLRFYAISDHAVGLKQDRDKTCLMVAGVDEHDNIWIMDDLAWGRWATDVVVEKMIDLMAKYRPLFWWAERGHISKSIGPFLLKRMSERSVYCAIDEIHPIADKMQRAQSIRGRVAMGKVYLPTYAPWYAEARDQLLKFPYGTHDDFVDCLGYLGLGLAKTVPARKVKPEAPPTPKGITLGMIKRQTEKARRLRANGGWL